MCEVFCLAVAFHNAVNVTLGVFFLHILTLVVLLFSFTNGEFKLHISTLSIQRNRYYCQVILLFKSGEPSELFFVEKQFTWSFGVVIFWSIGGLVRRNMHPH